MKVLVLALLVACGSRKDHDKPAPVGSASAASDAAVTVASDAKASEQVAAELDKKCLASDAEACRNLGVLYSEGLGVPKDPKRATALFALACNGGNLAGCNHTALALAEGIGVEKDVAKAVELYTKACDGNNALACRNLGLMLRDGRGIAKDVAKAETLLEKACTSNAPFACTNAGELQKTLGAAEKPGKDRDARFEKMLALFTQGCNAKDPTACRSIGIAYLEGTGLPKTPNAAAVWLAKGCEPESGTIGDPIACRVYGAMLIDGVGVKQDAAKGRELMKHACDRKDADACRLLSDLDRGSNQPGSGSGAAPKAPM